VTKVHQQQQPLAEMGSPLDDEAAFKAAQFQYGHIPEFEPPEPLR
jgi:hypothetical protein